MEKGCWPEPEGYGGYGGGDGSSGSGQTTAGSESGAYGEKPPPDSMTGCLDPDCPCDHLVPLAVITAPEGLAPITKDAIDTSGQRKLGTPPESLTHIAHINWPHGGQMTLAELRAQNGELRITFDRKIVPSPGDATGLTEHTFVVQYGGIQRSLEFLPSTDDTPTLQDDCVAVFRIEQSKLSPTDRHGNVAGNVVYVTLKCDFIIDCHGNAVDGNHLSGRLPSGDGVRGGVFESWFRVTYE
jgi:hypothetical protein